MFYFINLQKPLSMHCKPFTMKYLIELMIIHCLLQLDLNKRLQILRFARQRLTCNPPYRPAPRNPIKLVCFIVYKNLMSPIPRRKIYRLFYAI